MNKIFDDKWKKKPSKKELYDLIDCYTKEIERLNKRINELEDRLERIRNNEREKVGIKAARLGIPSHSLEKLQKLKGEDKK